MKTIIIAGGTGLIGQALVKSCLAHSWNVMVLGRTESAITSLYEDRVHPLTWDEFLVAPLHYLEHVSYVVNLCGTSIGDWWWTDAQKQDILDSRIQSTALLSRSCALMGERAPHLYQASAIGIYGLQESMEQGLPQALDEYTEIPRSPHDFLQRVGIEWEYAALPAIESGVPVTFCRFGVVLSRSGGVLPRLALPYYAGLGARMGSGAQPFTWVHIDDVIRTFEFLFERPQIVGPLNIVATQAVSAEQFGASLARVLHRPYWLRLPACLVKGLAGQMGEELLLAGQHVVPARLGELGFVHRYPTIDRALEALYGVSLTPP